MPFFQLLADWRDAGTFAGLDYQFYVVDQLNLLCAPSDRLAASGLKFEGAQIKV